MQKVSFGQMGLVLLPLCGVIGRVPLQSGVLIGTDDQLGFGLMLPTSTAYSGRSNRFLLTKARGEYDLPTYGKRYPCLPHQPQGLMGFHTWPGSGWGH